MEYCYWNDYTKLLDENKYSSWYLSYHGRINTAAETQQYIDVLGIVEPLLATEFITIDNEGPIEHLATVQEKEGDDEKDNPIFL